MAYGLFGEMRARGGICPGLSLPSSQVCSAAATIFSLEGLEKPGKV